jgi:hypothetical protein
MSQVASVSAHQLIIQRFLLFKAAVISNPRFSQPVENTTQTIRRLAMGNVILVGRGWSFISTHFPHIFHVRLIAPLMDRVRHIEEYYQLEPAEGS